MTLSIEHTYTDGTLLDGTAKGDGTADILKAIGWRWSRSLGLWHLPRSRYAPARVAVLDSTAARLRDAGHEVQVTIEDTTRRAPEQRVADVAAAEEAFAEATRARVQYRQARAQREQAASDARREASDAITGSYPFGQPVLVGHHSEGTHRRNLDRAARHLDKAIEHQDAARAADAAAQASASNLAHRSAPVTVANRLERLRAEHRAAARTRDRVQARAEQTGAPSPALARYDEQLADLQAKIDYWQGVRDQQIATGQARDYGPHNVRPGDAVRVSGSWYEVKRSNKATATVIVDPDRDWTSTTPWHRILDHRAARTS